MRKVLYILGQFDDHDLGWLVRNGRQTTYAPDSVLITQGQHSDDLFIVLSGHLNVQVAGIGTVAELGVGEIVGEMSFVDSLPPSATIVAKDTVQALVIDKTEMREELAENVGFAARFYRALSLFLADRLRSFQTKTAGTSGGADDDVLDENILDNVSQAGENFNRMIKRLSQT
jgi:CRP/FNR family transcriptional regulator, cyclic AMP receptor protein